MRNGQVFFFFLQKYIIGFKFVSIPLSKIISELIISKTPEKHRDVLVRVLTTLLFCYWEGALTTDYFLVIGNNRVTVAGTKFLNTDRVSLAV